MVTLNRLSANATWKVKKSRMVAHPFQALSKANQALPIINTMTSFSLTKSRRSTSNRTSISNCPRFSALNSILKTISQLKTTASHLSRLTSIASSCRILTHTPSITIIKKTKRSQKTYPRMKMTTVKIRSVTGCELSSRRRCSLRVWPTWVWRCCTVRVIGSRPWWRVCAWSTETCQATSTYPLWTIHGGTTPCSTFARTRASYSWRTQGHPFWSAWRYTGLKRS